MYITESFQEFKDELILEEFLNINIDGIKKKLKNMIGKNRIKINMKDLKSLIKKLGLSKGMNVKQIYSKLKKGGVDDIVNKIASQAKGSIDNKDSELVPVTESFLKVGEFFQKNKWAKFLFVAFVLTTIFSANAFGNNIDANDLNNELGDDVRIELDGGDDGGDDGGNLDSNHPNVTDVEKNSDGSYTVKVKLKNSSVSRLQQVGRSQAGLIASGEALSQEGLETANVSRTIVDSDYYKLSNGTYEGEFTVKVNFNDSSNNNTSDNSGQERQPTQKSDYMESTLGDDDI